MGIVYTQLSMQERRRIEDWWLAKVPVAEMARVLKRHKSTIFREIKRNFWADDSLPKTYAGYFGMATHRAVHASVKSPSLTAMSASCSCLTMSPTAVILATGKVI